MPRDLTRRDVGLDSCFGQATPEALRYDSEAMFSPPGSYVEAQPLPMYDATQPPSSDLIRCTHLLSDKDTVGMDTGTLHCITSLTDRARRFDSQYDVGYTPPNLAAFALSNSL